MPQTTKKPEATGTSGAVPFSSGTGDGQKEKDTAAEKNKQNQVTEASQKGKAVDRDITDPSSAPEE